MGLAFDANGNLYVSDSLNARIRRIDAQGKVMTIAGNGVAGGKGDSYLAGGKMQYWRTRGGR